MKPLRCSSTVSAATSVKSKIRRWRNITCVACTFPACTICICPTVSPPPSCVSGARRTKPPFPVDWTIWSREDIWSAPPRTKSGTKVSTYYTSDNEKVFAVKLTGYFDYTYGSNVTATNQSVSVVLYKDEASFVTKSSRRSGATVYGSGTVSYLGYTRAKSLTLTCDVYGNLS